MALLGLTSVGAPAFARQSTAETPTILILGDSLSAEYGLPRGTGWVALMEQKLKQQNILANVINASVSGETTAGGRARLPALLARHRPDIVVIELGANDALHGQPLVGSSRNLTQLIKLAHQSKAKVVLVGMQIPPNLGLRYSKQFAALFPKVAKSNQAALVPFLLRGVADRSDAMSYFQDDGVHPTAAAQPHMLENVWAVLQDLLP